MDGKEIAIFKEAEGEGGGGESSTYGILDIPRILSDWTR